MLNSKTSVKLAALPFFALSLLAQPVTTPSSEPQERRLGHTVEGTRPSPRQCSIRYSPPEFQEESSRPVRASQKLVLRSERREK